MSEQISKEIYLWVAGAVSFALSSIGILIGLLFLFLSEGPGSPDIITSLTTQDGRQKMLWMVAGITVGPVFCIIGFAILFTFLRKVNFVSMLVSFALSILSGTLFVIIAAFHYSLIMLAKEGFTSDNGLRMYSVATHYFADVSGWTAIACFAFATLIVSLNLRKFVGWKIISYFGITIAIIAVVLFLLDSSYLFLIPFSLWLLSVAITFVINRKSKFE